MTKAEIEDVKLMIQVMAQNTFIKLLEDTSEMAKKADLAYSDFAYALGSAIASVIFEGIREPEQEAVLNLEQKSLLETYEGFLILGYDGKIEFLEQVKKPAGSLFMQQ